MLLDRCQCLFLSVILLAFKKRQIEPIARAHPAAPLEHAKGRCGNLAVRFRVGFHPCEACGEVGEFSG
jgi:hypothetical protein